MWQGRPSRCRKLCLSFILLISRSLELHVIGISRKCICIPIDWINKNIKVCVWALFWMSWYVSAHVRPVCGKYIFCEGVKAVIQAPDVLFVFLLVFDERRPFIPCRNIQSRCIYTTSPRVSPGHCQGHCWVSDNLSLRIESNISDQSGGSPLQNAWSSSGDVIASIGKSSQSSSCMCWLWEGEGVHAICIHTDYWRKQGTVCHATNVIQKRCNCVSHTLLSNLVCSTCL